MNGRHLGLRFLFSLAVMTVPVSASAQTADERAIRNVEARQADAWNRHDAAAYARLFTENGDVVNVAGWWWKGRAQIESKLTGAFAFVFHESTMSIADVDVKFLTREIAVAHVRWTLVGAKSRPGIAEPKEGIQLQVLKRIAGHWLIESFQNTNSVPERPFPTGPASPADSIVLERTLCFGTCSAYRLSLTRGGLVAFESHNPGDTTRHAQGTVPPTSLSLLTASADSLGFDSLPDTIINSKTLCPSAATDLPTATITIFRPSSTKRVVDYRGCGVFTEDGASAILRGLRVFEARIDTIAGSKQWVQPARSRR